MYKPAFKSTSNCVPVLSRDMIDTFAENFISDFKPEALTTPMEINVDDFLENYLGITPDYQYLAHKLIYLGMTVFHDTNKIVVFHPIAQKAEYISAKADTVIFDTRLLEASQEHRYRFTAGHESGHIVFHRDYFDHMARMSKFFNMDIMEFIQCRSLPNGETKKGNLKTNNDWLEWQANQFSSSLLMPKTAVLKLIDEFDLTSDFGVYDALIEMENVFNVSFEAATHRLSGMRMIKQQALSSRILMFA